MPPRHIVNISGKDSAAAALVQLARRPELPYEFVFCDTAMELPETYAWLAKLETTLDIQVIRIGKSLEQVIAEENMLPSHNRRFCTRLGKVFPVRDFIGKDNVVQYFGIRADEFGRIAGFSGPSNIQPCYPLVEIGIDLPAVYTILGNREILPPEFFWQRLWDAVWHRADDSMRVKMDSLTPWDRAALFSWRSRSNCFMCFYQRRYEWVGLLEHHPDLFAKAEAIEDKYGVGINRPCNEEFSWIDGLPLPRLRERAEEIFRKKVSSVIGLLAKRMQGLLWEEESNDLNVTSCGLYCGK